MLEVLGSAAQKVIHPKWRWIVMEGKMPKPHENCLAQDCDCYKRSK